MRASLVLGAGRGPRLAVLETVKRFPGGISVTDLSGELGMSYMGTKAHCVALEKSGYLEGRRGISTKGRPRLNYRLTDSGEDLFRGGGNDLPLSLLREASALFGTTAPRKILMMYFRTEATRYTALIRGINRTKRWPALFGCVMPRGAFAVWRGILHWRSTNAMIPLMNCARPIR